MNKEILNLKKYEGIHIKVTTMNTEYNFTRKPFTKNVWMVDANSSHVEKYEEVRINGSGIPHESQLFPDEIRVGMRLEINRFHRPQDKACLVTSTVQSIEVR